MISGFPRGSVRVAVVEGVSVRLLLSGFPRKKCVLLPTTILLNCTKSNIVKKAGFHMFWEPALIFVIPHGYVLARFYSRPP